MKVCIYGVGAIGGFIGTRLAAAGSCQVSAVARGATLRRRLITIPARLARPQRRPILHLPAHWPWATHWLRLWRNTIGHSPPATAPT